MDALNDVMGSNLAEITFECDSTSLCFAGNLLALSLLVAARCFLGEVIRFAKTLILMLLDDRRRSFATCL